MDRGAWRAAVHGVTRLSTSLHEGGGGWVVSDKLVELKKKRSRDPKDCSGSGK